MSKTFDGLMRRKRAQLRLVRAALDDALLPDVKEIAELTEYEILLLSGIIAATDAAQRAFSCAEDAAGAALEKNKAREQTAYRADSRIIDLSDGEEDDRTIQEDDRQEDGGTGQDTNRDPDTGGSAGSEGLPPVQSG